MIYISEASYEGAEEYHHTIKYGCVFFSLLISIIYISHIRKFNEKWGEF